MVWTNSQHQRSSIPAYRVIHTPARAAMSFADDATATAAPTSDEPIACADGSRFDDDAGEPTATVAPPPAGGEAAASAPAPFLPPAGQPGSSTDVTAASAPWPLSDKGKSIVDEINALKAEQRAARDAKKKISKDLRNAEKRRQRLKKRAKLLSDRDLLAVMSLRAHEKASVGGSVAGGNSGHVDGDESESGSATSPSTAAPASASCSPMLQPEKRARSA